MIALAVAFVAGTIAGVVLVSILVAGRDRDGY